MPGDHYPQASYLGDFSGSFLFHIGATLCVAGAVVFTNILFIAGCYFRKKKKPDRNRTPPTRGLPKPAGPGPALASAPVPAAWPGPQEAPGSDDAPLPLLRPARAGRTAFVQLPAREWASRLR